MPPFRNRKFLDLAHRVECCQLRMSLQCTGATPDGCEPAHSNSVALGKGVGIKGPDVHVAACHLCHMEYDSGKEFSRGLKQQYWQQGFVRTMIYYLERGWLEVSG